MQLDERLKNINRYPFHMPGHKRNSNFDIDGSLIDITEIDGFDDLHCPTGSIKEIENGLSEVYHSNKSILSVNGSTCGILAAINAICSEGDKIVIARNCHKSVYNACFIAKLNVIYAKPEFDEKNGFYKSVCQNEIDTILNNSKDVKAVVITSPTYEGYVSDIKCSVPIIIDSAHGAHFPFANWLPNTAKGDVVITSLHKTLPCLTGCAVVNIYNDKYCNNIKKYMDIFETSSPSYVLMNSVAKCLDIVKNRELFINLKSNLDKLYSTPFKHLKLIKADDITKINISTTGSNINGNILSKMLRDEMIEVEMSDAYHVIAISTIGDTDDGFKLLINALKKIDRDIEFGNVKISEPNIPPKEYDSFVEFKTKATRLTDAVGKICCEYVFAYPPGIPLLVPGEIITEDIVSYIALQICNSTNIVSESQLLPDEILTKA